MKIEKSNILTSSQKKDILKIWNNEYPASLAYDTIPEFEEFLQKLKNAEHYTVDIDNETSGWITKFDRNKEKWFVVMVDSKKQGNGIGTELINALKQNTTDLNGWVVDTENYLKRDGQVYKPPIEFYKKVGFKITDERMENEKLSVVRVRWTKKPAHNDGHYPLTALPIFGGIGRIIAETILCN